MNEKIFYFSKSLIDQRKSFFLIFRIIISFFFILLFLFPINILKDRIPIVILLSSLFFGIIIFQFIISLVSFFIFRILEQTKIVIKNNSIQKLINDNIVDKIDIDKEVNLVCVFDKNRQVINLKISNKGKKLVIFGIEKLNDLYNEIINLSGKNGKDIQEKSIDDLNDRTTQIKIIINNTLNYIGILVMMLAITFLLFKSFKINLSEIINAIIPIIIGLFFILFQPLSKRIGSKYKNLEIILGGILILLSILQILISLL